MTGDWCVSRVVVAERVSGRVLNQAINRAELFAAEECLGDHVALGYDRDGYPERCEVSEPVIQVEMVWR